MTVYNLPRTWTKVVYDTGTHRERGESFTAYVAKANAHLKELVTALRLETQDQTLDLPSVIKGLIVVHNANLSDSDYERLSGWTQGSFDHKMIIEKMRRLDRPDARLGDGKNSKHRNYLMVDDEGPQVFGTFTPSMTAVQTGTLHDQQDLNTLNFHVCEFDDIDMSVDAYDEDIVYIPVEHNSGGMLEEDDSVAILANYKQVRNEIHKNEMRRGYFKPSGFAFGASKEPT